MTDQGGAPAPSGSQGTASPELLQSLKEDLLSTLRQDISAAITSRLGGRDELRSLREEIHQVLAGQQQRSAPASSANGNGKSGGEGTPSEVEALREEIRRRDAALTRERKNAALREALSRSGVRPESLNDALQLLSSREDIKPSEDAHGNTIWRGTVRGEIGEMEADLDGVVRDFIRGRSYLLPPQSGGGSGASGGNFAGTGKSVEQLTDAELAALPPERLEELWVAGGGKRTLGGGGFFDDISR